MGKLVLVAILGTGIGLGGSFNANANIIYNWTGTCTFGCTGQASMQLLLADSYIPGTPLIAKDEGKYGGFVTMPPEILSWTYSDNNTSFNFASCTGSNFCLVGMTLDLPVDSGPGFLRMFSEGASFHFDVGFWNMAVDNIFSVYRAGGSESGNWQRVPEPATLVLLGIGLAGLGFARRRKLN